MNIRIVSCYELVNGNLDFTSTCDVGNNHTFNPEEIKR